MTQHLEPCPFCGSNQILILDQVEYAFGMCKRCDAAGPLSCDDDEAIQRWNLRYHPPERDSVPDPLVTEIERLDKELREARMQTLASMGQAQDAWEEAQRRAKDEIERLKADLNTPFNRGYLAGWVSNWLDANPDERLKMLSVQLVSAINESADLTAKLKLAREGLEEIKRSNWSAMVMQGRAEITLKAIGGDE